MRNSVPAALIFVWAAHAQEPGVLSLDEVVTQALQHNPEITAAQKRYEAMRQKPRMESALPDPMVGIGYNSSGSPRQFAGIGREQIANSGLMVTQELTYLGKRLLGSEVESWEAYCDL